MSTVLVFDFDIHAFSRSLRQLLVFWFWSVLEDASLVTSHTLRSGSFKSCWKVCEISLIFLFDKAPLQ